MSGGLGGMTAEQLLQQRLLRSRLRGAQHPGLSVGGPLPPPLLQPAPPCLLSPPSPPDSPPPGTTPAEIPAGPRYPSETWCSLCRVYCPDPVCLPCGHNFCTGCIGQRLGEPKINISCLECGASARKRNLRPIKPPPLLANLVVERPKRQRLDSFPGAAAAAAVATVVAPPSVGVAPAAPSPVVTAPTIVPPAPVVAKPATPPPRAPTPPTPPLLPAPSPSPAAPSTPPPAPLPIASPTGKRAPVALGGAGDGSGERLCEIHQDVLQFFCEEDQTPICAHCDRSQEHRAHTIFHVERAARDYRPFLFIQERVKAQLESLKQEKNELWNQKLTGEKKIQEYTEKVQTERKDIVTEFEQLHQFLKKQEERLLTQLEELDKDIEKQKDDMMTQISEELSRIGDVITEMEVKCKQPASEFLQQTSDVPPQGSQDIKKNLARCTAEQFPSAEEATSKLGDRLELLSRKGVVLKKTMNRFQDNVTYAIERTETLRSLNDKGIPTLDPDFSSALLPLDQRNAGDGESQHRLPALHYVPDTPQRLDSRALVLGCDGFTSGRYFWELEVGDGEFWAVGVTRDPSKKKGMMDFSPEEGIWAVGLWKGQHWALTSPVTALSLSKHPQRIRVSLDYVGECVTFTDADTEDPIFTFPPASFNGTRAHPLLWVVGFPAQTVFLRRMGVKYPVEVHEMDIISP
ncbi:tripartite motif-containing protein 15-like isoform X3 [Crotalus tigris]|uniref:tripartite motif-containing protein 15-like isoform X3 n=1 Tax=Crotalus tigris TaxID=88082 RepID=UPI00192F5402|nr:tripartite motif-containing protein 15-like isoform X3 [Crotalus tigris]